MQVTFWGTRGSIAKAGPSTVRYGGNTSCVEVRTGAGTLIVIDCGTGAHGLGADLVARSDGSPIDGHLLISHTHWDHIQGLPFFAPLFQPGNTWHIYGPRGLGSSVVDVLAGQMQHTYFPVSLEQLAAQVQYHDLVEGTFDIDDVTITTQYLNHPALTLGYRLHADGAAVAYAADHEPHRPSLANGTDLGASHHDRAHVDFLRGADLVIHDAQYLASEYSAKTGWGHSTVEYVVAVAHQAGAAAVALYHHDPSRNDSAVDAVVALAKGRAAALGYEGTVFAAAEGLTLDVHGNGSADRPVTEIGDAATRTPALEQASPSVLIAVASPVIAASLREASEVEALEIWEATTQAATLDLIRRHQPSVVVLEDVDDALGRARAICALDADVNVITVSRSGIRPDADQQRFTDWLVWPSSVPYLRTRLHAALLRRACRWQNASLPLDEVSRVRSLHALDVLDTEPEARFDRFTREASELLDTPVALVSLVDVDRQWFKSAHGFDATETPRDVAFCAHAILDDEIMQVPDALQDPRFADNPVVQGDPRIRFYAGVPLRLANGSPVGTLCVIDYRPRLLDDEQLATLRRLGKQVAQELETPTKQ